MADFRKRYEQRQVKNMLVNPYAQGDILEAYPFLKDLVPEDTMGFNGNKYFRVMSLVLDKRSPMAKDFPAYGQRVREACADFSYKAEWEPDFRHIALEYLRFMHDELWTEIQCNEMVLWQYAQRLSKPIDAKETDDKKILQTVELQGKMLDQMQKIRANITALRKEFYGEDREMMETEERDWNPQAVAKTLRPKKD